MNNKKYVPACAGEPEFFLGEGKSSWSISL